MWYYLRNGAGHGLRMTRSMPVAAPIGGIDQDAKQTESWRPTVFNASITLPYGIRSDGRKDDYNIEDQVSSGGPG